jgi:serine protease Do
MEVLRGSEKKMLFIPAIEEHDPVDQLFDAADAEKNLISRLGIIATDLTSSLRNEIGTLRISTGVVVLGRAVDLITPETGLQTGDIIHSLNTTPIRSMDELRAAVQNLKVNDPVVIQVERSDGLTYLSFEMQ